MRSTHRPMLDTVAEIETPEHIHFSHRIAGPPRRALAWLLDGLIKTFIVLVFSTLLPRGSDEQLAAATGLMAVLSFVLEWGYHVFFEAIWSGKTPGKAALKLRVVKESGSAITVQDSIVRNLLRAADLFFAIGLVVCASDRWFRRIGDLVAGTMVIVETNTRITAPLVVSPPPTEHELTLIPRHPPVNREELDTIEYFLRRSDSLSVARTDELAGLIAPIFAERMGLRMADASRLLALVYHRARLE